MVNGWTPLKKGTINRTYLIPPLQKAIRQAQHPQGKRYGAGITLQSGRQIYEPPCYVQTTEILPSMLKISCPVNFKAKTQSLHCRYSALSWGEAHGCNTIMRHIRIWWNPSWIFSRWIILVSYKVSRLQDHLTDVITPYPRAGHPTKLKRLTTLEQ